MDLTKVRQPYVLTMSRHKLNVHEMRVMFRIIESLQDKMATNIQSDLFGDLEVHLQTKQLLPEGSFNYTPVKKALETLRKKDLEIISEDTDGKYATTLGYILRYKYYLNNQMIKVELPSELAGVYLELAKGYTRYALEVAFNSDSSYTMKLYQYISHWKDKPAITVDYAELRELLGIGNKYKQIGQFKDRVLHPAVKELKEKGDVWFEYKDIKVGRTITGFVFKIHVRATTEKERGYESAMQQNIIDLLRRHFNANDKHIEKVLHIISKAEYQPAILDKLQHVAQHIDQSNVKNRAAYVIKSLEQEFGQRSAQQALF